MWNVNDSRSAPFAIAQAAGTIVTGSCVVYAMHVASGTAIGLINAYDATSAAGEPLLVSANANDSGSWKSSNGLRFTTGLHITESGTPDDFYVLYRAT